MKHDYLLIFSACFFLCFPIYGRASDDGSSFAYDDQRRRVEVELPTHQVVRRYRKDGPQSLYYFDKHLSEVAKPSAFNVFRPWPKGSPTPNPELIPQSQSSLTPPVFQQKRQEKRPPNTA